MFLNHEETNDQAPDVEDGEAQPPSGESGTVNPDGSNDTDPSQNAGNAENEGSTPENPSQNTDKESSGGSNQQSSSSSDSKANKKSGCRAVVGSSASLMALLCLAAMTFKRKEN